MIYIFIYNVVSPRSFLQQGTAQVEDPADSSPQVDAEKERALETLLKTVSVLAPSSPPTPPIGPRGYGHYFAARCRRL